GGEQLDGKGYFYKPSIVVDVDQKDEIVQKEVFGPVVTVQHFVDDAQAIAWANDVPYGLSASVWTTNVSRALNAARLLRFGTVRLGSVYGDRVAFRLEERSALARKREMTFNDVDRVVTRLATVLGKEGLPLGELVAVVPSNGIDFLLTLLAVVRAGGIAVPIN